VSSAEADTVGDSAGKHAGESMTPMGPHALLGRVWYPDANDTPRAGGYSLLLVLKPGISGDEPLDLAYYKQAHEAFPQETTLEQYFNEAQWESYRKLGRHIGEQVFPEGGEPTWLGKLAPQRA